MPDLHSPAVAKNATESMVSNPVPAERYVDSITLLGQQRSVAIRHHNEIYRLRQTRQGKLILTK